VILVVEDHDDARSVLVRLLKRAGYRAIGVANGNEALLFLQTSLPRLVILDYQLPGVDGLEVLRQIRADARLKDVPVAFYSAADATVMKPKAMAAGANEYLIKGALDWAAILVCLEKYGTPKPNPAPAPKLDP
jgi:CheY-like chemotaxis protein